MMRRPALFGSVRAGAGVVSRLEPFDNFSWSVLHNGVGASGLRLGRSGASDAGESLAGDKAPEFGLRCLGNVRPSSPASSVP